MISNEQPFGFNRTLPLIRVDCDRRTPGPCEDDVRETVDLLTGAALKMEELHRCNKMMCPTVVGAKEHC